MKRILILAVSGLLFFGWGASGAEAGGGSYYYAQPQTGVVLYFGYPVYQYAPRYYHRPHYGPYYRPQLRRYERMYRHQHVYPAWPRGPWYRHR